MLSAQLSTVTTGHSYRYKSNYVYSYTWWPRDGYGDGSNADFFGYSIVANKSGVFIGAPGEQDTWYTLQYDVGRYYKYTVPTGVTYATTSSYGPTATQGGYVTAYTAPWITLGTSSTDYRAYGARFGELLRSHPKNNTYFLIGAPKYKPNSTTVVGRYYYSGWVATTPTAGNDSPITSRYTNYASDLALASDSSVIVGAPDMSAPTAYGRAYIYNAPNQTLKKTIALSGSYQLANTGVFFGSGVAIEHNGIEHWYAVSTRTHQSNTIHVLANSSTFSSGSITTSETIYINDPVHDGNRWFIEQPWSYPPLLRGNTLIITSSDGPGGSVAHVDIRNVMTHGTEDISSNGYYRITGLNNLPDAKRAIELIDDILYVGDMWANSNGVIYIYDMKNFPANATSNVINKYDCDGQIVNTGYKTGTGAARAPSDTDYWGSGIAVVGTRIYVGAWNTMYAGNTSNVGAGVVHVYDNVTV